MEESDPGGGETWCGCGIGWGDAWGQGQVEVCAPGVCGEAGEGGLEEGEAAGNWSLFIVLGLEVLRNNVICS